MKVVWATRSFLDYRVPVYKELNLLLNGAFALIYNADVVPPRVQAKAQAALGENAIGLIGEWRVGSKRFVNRAANSVIRVPWQPGLLRRIRSHKPDVVITDGFFQWTAASLWLRRTRHVAHVMCYERTAHTERKVQWYRRLYRKWALRYVDVMCCNGRLCGEYAQQLGMPGNRIVYGHMTADTEALNSAKNGIPIHRVADLRQGLRIKGICLLYVGRLTVEKGLRHLLVAWASIHPEISARVSLLLVGDGPDREFLESFCKAKGLSNVHFAGVMDYDILPLYYASADAFVIPTLEDNWSMVVPEAMACGLPILCSKYNGCWPELVHEGRNGWLFDPQQPAETARCLEECIRSKEKLPAMGAESALIVKNHTPQRAAQSILEACRMAVSQARRHRGAL